MGTRGPIPNRSDDLSPSGARNRRSPGQEVTKGVARPVEVPHLPEISEDWHQLAKTMFASVANSGQADYYQSGDYAVLWLLCDEINYHLTSGKRSAERLQAILSGLGSLMVTEGDRRRLRLELGEAPESKPDFSAEVGRCSGKPARASSTTTDRQRAGLRSPPMCRWARTTSPGLCPLASTQDQRRHRGNHIDIGSSKPASAVAPADGGAGEDAGREDRQPADEARGGDERRRSTERRPADDPGPAGAAGGGAGTADEVAQVSGRLRDEMGCFLDALSDLERRSHEDPRCGKGFWTRAGVAYWDTLCADVSFGLDQIESIGEWVV